MRTGPAGGRPASGLSRRRTSFRGPPPSFYRNGGWGTQTRRRQAQANTTEFAAQTGSTDHRGNDDVQYDPDVPHFDSVAHLRTQRNYDHRRTQRMAAHESGNRHGQTRREDRGGDGNGGPSWEAETDIWVRFVFVGGILTLGLVIPSFLSSLLFA